MRPTTAHDDNVFDLNSVTIPARRSNIPSMLFATQI